ncbi:relaxase domain-containing protein [bacterium]|nr:relaxase domain-containing protein [bacterium]
MLSLNTLKTTQQAVTYFEHDNYYSRQQSQEASRWYGAGAEKLGLSGPLSTEDFRNLLNGNDPEGNRIVQLGPFEKHRPGFDLTFSAPKSASLEALVNENEKIRQAWDRSVDRALEQVQRDFAETRITTDGQTEVVKTGNLIIARFEHDSSRSHDPQLHSHCVAISATEGPDGKWHALYTDDLYKYQRAIGMRQQLDFANELEQLGYKLERGANGKFEIAGFTEEQLKEFSQRSEQIKEEQYRLAQVMGADAYSSHGAEIATLNTRDAKRIVDHDELRKDWRARAEEVGIHWPEPNQALEARQEAAKEAIEFARQHAFERSSVVSRYDIKEAAYEYGIGRSSVEEIERAFKQSIQHHKLTQVDQNYFTTPEAIQRERDTIHTMQRGRNASEQIANPRALEAPDHFTEGQRDASVLILTSRDSTVGVQGYSGSGKSSMLAYTREQAEERGWSVRGFAPSAQAAEELEKKSGIRSQTLTSHLNELAAQKIPNIRGKEIWIVDEASMVSTAQANELLHQAERRGVKVALIGDTNQLASIEAGAPFAQLQKEGMKTAQMREILRQEEGPARKAVELQYEGRQRAAMNLIPTFEIEQRESRHQAVADDYLRIGNGAVVLTLTNSDKNSINEKIRDGLIQKGELGAEAHTATVLIQKDLSKAELKEAFNYERGDVIRFGRDQKKLGIEKGGYTEVLSNDQSGGVHIRNEKGEIHTWYPELSGKAIEVYKQEHREIREGEQLRFTRNDSQQGFINNKTAIVKGFEGDEAILEYKGKEQRMDLNSRRHHFDYGYASTAHSAQGIDSESAVVDLDTRQRRLIGKESVLVMTSRGKQGTIIYTDNTAALPWRIQESHAQKNASAELHRVAEINVNEIQNRSKGIDFGP